MGINGMHSINDMNIKLMESIFGMEEYNVCKIWEHK